MDFTVNSINETSNLDSIESLLKKLLWLDSTETVQTVLDDFNGDQTNFEWDLETSALFINKNIEDLTRCENPIIGSNNWQLLLNSKASNIKVESFECSDNDTNEIVRDFTLYKFSICSNNFIYLQWDI